jgi:hypothetical protein
MKTSKSKNLLLAGMEFAKKAKRGFAFFGATPTKNRSVFPCSFFEKGKTAFCLFRKP